MMKFAMLRFLMTLFNHSYGSKVVCALCFMLSISLISYSQVPGKNETLEYINKKLGSAYVIEINKGTIIANYSSPDGKRIREDKVFSGLLDTTISYDSNEHLLYVNCLGIEGDCVTRNLFVQKIKRNYARISFVVDDQATVDKLKIALRHLIRILSEPKYNDEISLDL